MLQSDEPKRNHLRRTSWRPMFLRETFSSSRPARRYDALETGEFSHGELRVLFLTG